MDADHLRKLLTQLQRGSVDVESVVSRLKSLPFEDLGFAKIDSHRCLRTGVPEVIFCQGKTVEQIQTIVQCISLHHHNVMATRAGPEVFQAVREVTEDCLYHQLARMVIIKPLPVEPTGQRRGGQRRDLRSARCRRSCHYRRGAWQQGS